MHAVSTITTPTSSSNKALIFFSWLNDPCLTHKFIIHASIWSVGNIGIVVVTWLFEQVLVKVFNDQDRLKGEGIAADVLKYEEILKVN